MHPSLSRFVSQHYYGGALTEVPVPHQQAPLEWLQYDQTSVLETHIATQRTGVFNVIPAPLTATASHSDNEKSNAAEAAMAARLVEAIASLCAQNGELPDWQHRLGIIVPFRSQIALIRNEMDKRAIPSYGDINIDTVERYQGSQRDIIIFSATVRSAWGLSILSAPVQQTDCLIDRKLNVALTRARKQFFLIGDATLLSQSQPYRELLASLPTLCY